LDKKRLRHKHTNRVDVRSMDHVLYEFVFSKKALPLLQPILFRLSLRYGTLFIWNNTPGHRRRSAIA
jgi:hypothetical protein